MAGRGPAASLTLLDIACGTGNQQIANLGLAPNVRLVGLDGSLGMLREAFRVLRRGGRFALYNPQDSGDWLYYAYFPEAKTRDFADFRRSAADG